MKAFKITVKGKVQGVFYRATALDQAKLLGLKGFVMNLPQGDVYIEAEGEPNKLNNLIEWCKKEPANAMVEEVLFEETSIKHYKKFEVRHI